MRIYYEIFTDWGCAMRRHFLFYLSVFPLASWAASPPEILADNPQKKTEITTREKPAVEKNVYGKPVNQLPWMQYTKSQGPSLMADFLYWYTTEGGQDFATNTYNNSHVIHGDTASPVGAWDPGMRWTFSYNLPYDGWDVQSSWTFLFTKGSESMKPDPSRGNRVAPLWDVYNPVGGALTAHSRWRINYNVLDIYLGRSFFISDFFTLRPFFGLEFGFIYQHTDIIYTGLRNLDARGPSLDSEFKGQQNFVGGGGSFGFSSQWYVTKQCNIYVSGSTSLVWARSKVQEREKVLDSTGFESFVLRVDSLKSPIRTHIQYAMGFMYHYYNEKTMFHIGYGAAWEFSDWINFNDFRKYAGMTEPGKAYIDGDGDLQSSGLTLRLRFDF